MAPMHALFSVLSELNRAQPGAQTVLGRDDWRAMFTRMAEVMRDKDRGFERLFRIVQCREGCPN
jgi:hypothetical protein